MRKGIQPGTEKRCEMLRIYMEKGLPLSMIGQYTKQMRGKTDEEKERIAEQVILELESKSSSAPIP